MHGAVGSAGQRLGALVVDVLIYAQFAAPLAAGQLAGGVGPETVSGVEGYLFVPVRNAGVGA